MEEEDDPVVQEVDVFLSKRLADSLYLFQYPARPSNRHLDGTNHLGARVKLKQSKVELDLEIDTHGKNYSRSKGEQIAINVDSVATASGCGDGAQMYLSEKMDKQVLTSMPSAGLPASRFVAGCVHQGELHVTPLKEILQLRPSFSYLDRADTKQATGAGGEEAQDDEAEEAKPVTVSFARRSEGKQKKTFKNVTQERESEAWVHMVHHKKASPESEQQRRLLIAERHNEVSEFQVPPNVYLERLVTKEEEETQRRPPMPSNVLSMAELRTMTLSDQIKALITNAKVLRFSELLSLLSKNTDPNTALTLLQQVALMVQGCWVVKSDILYPKDTKSAHSGVPAETLCRGRDYILWRFTLHGIVIRKEISSVLKIPAEEVKEILQQMARCKSGRGWEFLYKFDSEFVNRHPEAVRMQQMRWNAKFDALCQALNLSKADRERKAKSDELAASASGGDGQPAAGGDKPKRRRTMSRSRTRSTGTGSGMSDLSDGELEASHKEPRSRKFSGQNRARRNSGRGELPTKADIPPPGDVAGAPNTCVNGEQQQQQPPSQGPVILQHNPSEEPGDLLKTEVHNFVREKLLSRGAVSSSEIKKLFDMHLTQLPSGHILGKGVSDKMLQQSLLDQGAALLANHHEPVFVRSRVNDGHDDIRAVIIEYLRESPKIMVQKLKPRLQEKLGAMPPDAAWRKVLKEFCVLTSNHYTLKGLVPKG